MSSLDSDDRMFRTVIEKAADGVLVGRADGCILTANPAACTIFNATEEQLRDVGFEGIADRDDPGWVELRAERRKHGWAKGVAPMLRIDGTALMAEVSSALFEGPDEEERIFVMVRDVTEQVRGQRRLVAYDEVTRALLVEASTSDVLNLVARHACVIFDADQAAVFVQTESGDGIEVAAVGGLRGEWEIGRTYPPGGFGELVMTTRTPLLLGDASATTRHRSLRDGGIGTAMMVPIISDETVLGVLFVGAAQARRPYDEDELDAAAVYAKRAGVALALGAARAEAVTSQRRLTEQLQQALDSRIIIEQAKGFLSCLHHIPPQEAFDRLRQYARSHNTNIHSIAAQVMERKIIL